MPSIKEQLEKQPPLRIQTDTEIPIVTLLAGTVGITLLLVCCCCGGGGGGRNP
ncbi:hypothetical protein TcasGA2_TC034576 [Tribolium castaneum]|uniref:Uncharacterized protein n=1 Tax=Tribolium castaneum TaxID=7070 RepID=A0A139WLX6_TRICA|nr:hypothetical protein TcasGA2_TC034576 [Tribolium castaneum]